MVCFLLVYLSLSLSFQPALVFIQNLQAIEQHSRWHVLARIRRHVEPLPPVVDLPEGDLRSRTTRAKARRASDPWKHPKAFYTIPVNQPLSGRIFHRRAG